MFNKNYICVPLVCFMRINLTPTLEDSKVFIRKLVEDDYYELFKIAEDSILWEYHPVKGYTKVGYHEFFYDAITKGALLIIDKKSRKIIGTTRFYNYNKIESSIVIGHTFISRDYWGTGYNGRIKNLLLNFIFNFITKVIFYIAENNIRSRKAIEKFQVSIDGIVIRNYGNKKIKCIIYTLEKGNF